MDLPENRPEVLIFKIFIFCERTSFYIRKMVVQSLIDKKIITPGQSVNEMMKKTERNYHYGILWKLWIANCR